ncbi:hypothetical protein D3C77_315950 [compost metagenome]
MLAGRLAEGAKDPLQVVAVGVQLLLKRLAPYAQPLPFQAVLLQLAAQQLRLLLGLGPALLRITQLAVSLVHVQAGLAHFVIDAHALFQQFFEFQA